jgi:hypothetical protein
MTLATAVGVEHVMSLVAGMGCRIVLARVGGSHDEESQRRAGGEKRWRVDGMCKPTDLARGQVLAG